METEPTHPVEAETRKAGVLIDSGLPICPHCKENNLHHLGVEVFNSIEDAETLTRTKVYSGLIREQYLSVPPR